MKEAIKEVSLLVVLRVLIGFSDVCLYLAEKMIDAVDLPITRT